MAELADAVDSKSTAPKGRASSSLAPGITNLNTYGFLVKEVNGGRVAIVPVLSRSFAGGVEIRRAASLRSCLLTIFSGSKINGIFLPLNPNSTHSGEPTPPKFPTPVSPEHP